MDKAKLAGQYIKLLKPLYAKPQCALEYRDPLQLLVATILSAQCTDERVNKVTPALFKKYRSAKDFAAADVAELEGLVRSTGFYHNKAKSIIEASKTIAEKFGGKVPDNMEDLLSLRGVARKTANVVLSSAYGKSEGVVVDTHVRRIAFRMGLTDNTEPEKIERDLMELLPRSQWMWWSYAIVLHGRALCMARKPDCAECPAKGICPKRGVA